MKKFAGIVAAVACALTISVPAPALAQISFGFGGYGGYYDYYPSRPLYRRNYYHTYRYRRDYDDEVYNYRSSDDDHVARCEAHYRSYNADTDMFLGYDGEYHFCEL